MQIFARKDKLFCVLFKKKITMPDGSEAFTIGHDHKKFPAISNNLKLPENLIFPYIQPHFFVNTTIKEKELQVYKPAKYYQVPTIMKMNNLDLYKIKKNRRNVICYGIKKKWEKTGITMNRIPIKHKLIVDLKNKRIRLFGMKAKKDWVGIENVIRKEDSERRKHL
jgi:hypothetical protein